jgi:hypothetical protein
MNAIIEHLLKCHRFSCDRLKISYSAKPVMYVPEYSYDDKGNFDENTHNVLVAHGRKDENQSMESIAALGRGYILDYGTLLSLSTVFMHRCHFEYAYQGVLYRIDWKDDGSWKIYACDVLNAGEDQ